MLQRHLVPAHLTAPHASRRPSAVLHVRADRVPALLARSRIAYAGAGASMSGAFRRHELVARLPKFIAVDVYLARGPPLNLASQKPPRPTPPHPVR